MKKRNIILSLLAFILMTSCEGEKSTRQGKMAIIDVETAFQNPQELLLADLGEKQTYVPLETLDESLVKLNSQSKMIVTDQYFFIGDGQSPILCFDRSTGKFLRNIGNIGQGPGEYSNSTNMEVDAEAKLIYIRNGGSSYLCYDFEGKFIHTITMPANQFLMGSHYFMNNKAYAYQLPEGTRIDSLSIYEKNDEKQKALIPIQGSETFGGRFFMLEYEDGTWTSGNRLNSSYQSMNGELYHKDLFCDTLFQMKGLHRDEPIAAFHLGSFGGYNRYETTSGMEGKYILPRVLYNGEQVYFTLFTGLYDLQGFMRKAQSGGVRPSCGIYNFRTGEVKVQKEEMDFKHPEEAMPKACVYTLSTDGHWVVVYQADQLAEARENIPTENQPDWLKNLKEDDNPVILLVK